MSNINGGFPNGDRAALLSGLRNAGPRMQQHQLQQYQHNNGYENQSQQQLYYQTQQQQPMYGGTQLSQQQQQAQQLYAFQQAQVEMLQQQREQLLQLAMQEQILLQQQQALQAAQMAQAVQQQQQQQQGNNGTTQYARNGQRSVSASPIVQQNTNWTGNEHDAAARQERWGALRDLQQARKQREGPAPASASAAQQTFSPSVRQDWQAERMRAYEGKSGPATPVASQQAAVQHHHRKNSSVASSASIQSLSISEAGSQFSPNKGPALVLSSPGEEFDEDDYSITAGDEPTSPSLNASMRAATIHERLSPASGQSSAPEIASQASEQGKSSKKSASKKRHTVILSSSLPPFAMPVKNETSTESSSDGGAGSSGSSSPTESDHSEVASFESAGTANTSAGAISPIDVLAKAEAVQQMTAQAQVFNPKAAAFRPSSTGSTASAASSGTSTPALASQQLNGTSGPRYPSSLALRGFDGASGTSTAPSMRVFTAPAGLANSKNNGSITIIRQPKGPVDETELSSKNFAGMIRRRAVGALRVATFTYGAGNGRSPVASPVIGAFEHAADGMVSPPLPSAREFAGFGASLAERAMKRRSQQMQLGHTVQSNFGLGMY